MAGEPDAEREGGGADAAPCLPCLGPAQSGRERGGPSPWSDEQIRAAFEVGLSTIARVRRAYVDAGLEAALR